MLLRYSCFCNRLNALADDVITRHCLTVDEVHDVRAVLRNDEYLGAINLAEVIGDEVLEGFLVDVNAAKGIAGVFCSRLVQRSEALLGIRLMRPHGVHDGVGVRAIAAHVGLVQHKHFSKVVVASGVSLTSTALCVTQAEIKHTSRGNPIGLDLIVAAHVVADS